MVVRLRLARFGRKKRPYYRIRAANARAPRDGKCLEEVRRYFFSGRDLEISRVAHAIFFSQNTARNLRSDTVKSG